MYAHILSHKQRIKNYPYTTGLDGHGEVFVTSSSICNLPAFVLRSYFSFSIAPFLTDKRTLQALQRVILLLPLPIRDGLDTLRQ